MSLWLIRLALILWLFYGHLCLPPVFICNQDTVIKKDIPSEPTCLYTQSSQAIPVIQTRFLYPRETLTIPAIRCTTEYIHYEYKVYFWYSNSCKSYNSYKAPSFQTCQKKSKDPEYFSQAPCSFLAGNRQDIEHHTISDNVHITVDKSSGDFLLDNAICNIYTSTSCVIGDYIYIWDKHLPSDKCDLFHRTSARCDMYMLPEFVDIMCNEEKLRYIVDYTDETLIGSSHCNIISEKRYYKSRNQEYFLLTYLNHSVISIAQNKNDKVTEINSKPSHKLASHMSYLAGLSSRGLTETQAELYKSQCEQTRQTWRTALSLIKLNPVAAIQMFENKSHIHGIINGTQYYYKECYPITQYKIVDPISKTCILLQHEMNNTIQVHCIDPYTRLSVPKEAIRDDRKQIIKTLSDKHITVLKHNFIWTHKLFNTSYTDDFDTSSHFIHNSIDIPREQDNAFVNSDYHVDLPISVNYIYIFSVVCILILVLILCCKFIHCISYKRIPNFNLDL